MLVHEQMFNLPWLNTATCMAVDTLGGAATIFMWCFCINALNGVNAPLKNDNTTADLLNNYHH